METGVIGDDQISSSGSVPYYNPGKYGRLDTMHTWQPRKDDQHQWLQIDLRMRKTKVTGVATQGNDQDDFIAGVTSYKLQYSDDGEEFEYYKENAQIKVRDT